MATSGVDTEKCIPRPIDAGSIVYQNPEGLCIVVHEGIWWVVKVLAMGGMHYNKLFLRGSLGLQDEEGKVK